MKVTVNSTAESETVANADPTAIPVAPIPPVAPKTLTWPEWYGVADLAMAVLVVIAAFGVASFAARNSDLWYHLGAGRLMAEGKSTFGVDPFSYMTEGRPWINHNWFWDRIAYAIYKSDTTGTWLVAAKAVGFAMAMVVMMLIRRPGAALWPWAVMAGLAVMAGSQFTHLRPFALNPLFVAITLLVLFRLEWKPGSWRNPILLAVTFGIWANVDGCFILGPITVLLVLIGELIQNAMLKGRENAAGAFGSPPPTSGLIKALLLGIAACMANPHHVRVWQLPPEFAAGLPTAGMQKDLELFVAVLEPYSDIFWDKSAYGKNLNGAAYLILFVVSALAMALSFGKIRVAHFFVWLFFGYLSLHQWWFILPFSIVSATIAAAYLNLWSSGIQLKTIAHPPTRVYLLSSGVGRLMTTALAIVMVPAAWPGWLHPPRNETVNLRRVAWTVEPDEGLVATANVIQRWREKGSIPAEMRGFTPNVDFANYLAYFAPSEKVYANGRYTYHAAEMPDLLSTRQALFFAPAFGPDGSVDLAPVQQVMSRVNAEYLAAVSQAIRISNETTTTIQVTAGGSVWFVGGRGVIAGPATQTKVAFDPVVELLGPHVTPLPESAVMAPPAARESWMDDFIRRPKTSPFSIAESYALTDYSMFLSRQSQFFHEQQSLASAGVLGIGGVLGLRDRPRALTDAEMATPILSVRAARTAIAENPDSADAFRALAQVYANTYLPELFAADPQNGRLAEKQMQFISAHQRFLARLPKPELCNKIQATQAFLSCEQLAQLYQSTNQFDLCLDVCGKIKKFFLFGPGLDYQLRINNAGGKAEEAKAIKAEFDNQVKRLDDIETQMEKQVADRGDRLRAAGQLKGIQKFLANVQLGLPGAAIAIFEDVPEGGYDQEFGSETARVALLVVDMLTRAGQVERAGSQLDRLIRSLDDLAKDTKIDPKFVSELKNQVVEREFRLRVVEGNYRAAADAYERANAKKFTPYSAEILAAARPEVMDTSMVFGTAVMLGGHRPHAMIWNGTLAAESQFAFSRALIAVFDGRPLEAKARFAQSLSPQGVKGMVLPWSADAARYLGMIERANGPEKK